MEGLPWIVVSATKAWVMILCFVLFAVLMHIFLIRLGRLDKVAWKKVDYIWIAFAAVGLLSTTGEARKFLASNTMSSKQSQASLYYGLAHTALRDNSSPERCSLSWVQSVPVAKSPAPGAIETPAHHNARLKWWREARFGMFVHWGLYSGLAGTWDGKAVATKGGMEWIQQRVNADTDTYADRRSIEGRGVANWLLPLGHRLASRSIRVQ